MSSVLESSTAAMAAPQVSLNNNDNTIRNSLESIQSMLHPHGLEHIENLIRDYARENHKTENWVASPAQLDRLLDYIANNNTTGSSEPARVTYNYERATSLFHIFLSAEDEGFCPTQYEEKLRSVFVDLSDIMHARVLTSQFDQIIYNENAYRWLCDNNIPWENVVVQEAVDGTLILKFNHGNVEFNATRRCMDAARSCWNRKRSHLSLLEEVTAGRIKNPDPNLVYSLALIHPENENIVPATEKHCNGTAVLVDVRRKYTLESVPFSTKDMPNITLPRAKTLRVETWDALIDQLAEVDTRIEKSGRLETEGFVLKVYWDKEHTVLRKLLKIQTRVYRELKSMRPNTGSRIEMVLELFLRGNLNRYMKWSSIDRETKQWIYSSYTKLLEEVHSVYHLTRGRKNPNIYNALSGCWKSRLFEIHGLYLASHKPVKSTDTTDKTAENSNNDLEITVAVVDKYLRSCDIKDITRLIVDRNAIVQNLRNMMYQHAVKNTHPFYRNENIESLATELASEFKHTKPFHKNNNTHNRKNEQQADNKNDENAPPPFSDDEDA
jgi:hypothetical protein